MSADFAGRLRRLNLKVTPKRLAILDIMLQEQTYLSPEELRRRLGARFGNVGLPTVYRNLEELSAGGVLTRIHHPNRQLYYYFCPNDAHHHHFVCLSCRTVADIDYCGLSEMAGHIDGEVHSHIVQALGRCRRCRDAAAGVPA
jgi:Fe2+ or Zn2+ uptake regulation protein